MADCEKSCTGGCDTTCSGSCDSGCRGCSGCSGCTSCSGSCEGTCKGGCTGACKGGCSGTCYDFCSGTCTAECSNSCYSSCKTGCYTTCSGQCKGYCSEICQTYCQTQQTFSLNKIGKGTFSWTNPVEKNKTIKITASDWNKLKSYIQAAVPYCGGTKPTSSDVASKDIIYAKHYNDLANGLDLSNVAAKTGSTSIISSEVIDKLRTTYNSRQIKSSLPAGEYTGGQNECCQSGQVCMTSGQLLSHQNCNNNQIPTKCGNQTPGPQVGS